MYLFSYILNKPAVTAVLTEFGECTGGKDKIATQESSLPVFVLADFFKTNTVE
jgi:hypothetical protein